MAAVLTFVPQCTGTNGTGWAEAGPGPRWSCQMVGVVGVQQDPDAVFGEVGQPTRFCVEGL